MHFLCVLLGVEIFVRMGMEIRECRLTQVRPGIFAALRLVPLLNDVLPLPENRREPEKSKFMELHEEGHRRLRHGILRNLFKVILLMLAVWFLAYELSRNGLPLWQGALWLHLVAIPFRVLFHLYCWNQEYEADAFAARKLEKRVVKAAMRELEECEIPHTKIFALVYREHPTAVLRKKKAMGVR